MPRAAWLVLVPGLAFAFAARAVVPSAPKLMRAVAQANRDAGRSAPLRLEVTLVREDAPPDAAPVGAGELVSDPGGLARLELRLTDGRLERHLLRGAEYRMTRDRVPAVPSPPLLPPLPLLQRGSGPVLEGSLAGLGVDLTLADLGRSQGRDCVVVGGRAPLLSRAGAGEAPRPALWVELESYEIARVDLRGGVRYRLGPPRLYGDLRLPAWVGVEAPGAAPLRLLVRTASRVEASASDFADRWLTAP